MWWNGHVEERERQRQIAGSANAIVNKFDRKIYYVILFMNKMCNVTHSASLTIEIISGELFEMVPKIICSSWQTHNEQDEVHQPNWVLADNVYAPDCVSFVINSLFPEFHLVARYTKRGPFRMQSMGKFSVSSLWAWPVNNHKSKLIGSSFGPFQSNIPLSNEIAF